MNIFLRDPLKTEAAHYSLEDCIYEMELRSNEDSAIDSDDPYVLLEQKEKDLILAAELGKALLEKNIELSRQNEVLAEDFSKKLEVLEQEKYCLKRKLTTAESEYETRLGEMHADLLTLQKSLESQQDASRDADRERCLVIQELTDQNQRLLSQVQEAIQQQELLTGQLQETKDQCTIKMTLAGHLGDFEVLKDEVHLLSVQKQELQRRLARLTNEKQNISGDLNETCDKIACLERSNREQEMQLKTLECMVEELRTANSLLSQQIESLSRNSNSGNNSSILEEMLLDMLSDELLDSYDLACQLIRILEPSPYNQQPSPSPIDYQPGLLLHALAQLKKLVVAQECQLSGKQQVLEAELHQSREHQERLSLELTQKNEDLKAARSEAQSALGNLAVVGVQLSSAEEQCAILRQDLSESHLSRDELVRRAWEARDQAVARKNACEVELARTRVDYAQVSGQLVEAAQQKLSLNEQLEQWQLDMHRLIDEQLKKKLVLIEEKTAAAKRAAALANFKKKKRSRFFSILRR